MWRWIRVGLIAVVLVQQAAAQGVCAEVKIEIAQTVSMERQAFNAKLGIDNAVDLPITGLDVDVSFRDALGNVVVGTSDPGNTTAAFFIREDEIIGIVGGGDGTGTLSGSSRGELNWLIIPSAGAGGNVPQGQMYIVGATVRFTQGGEQRSINVSPDTIIVQPQPRLELDYFLTTEVYSDDPFTPEVEPVVPFTLGVRIRNVGAGPSQRTRIETAQPRIMENVQGLQINFNILDAFVGAATAQPTLTLDFGTVPAGSSSVGRWNMSTSVSGRFIDFAAEFTHDDALGGALTSLIERVDTHPLVKDVRNDASDRDAVRDFLALDGETYRSYESEGIDTVVIDRSKTTSVTAPGSGIYIVDMGASSLLPAYTRIPAPTGRNFKIASAIRLGAGAMPAENVWVSQRRRAGSTDYDFFLNIYDGRGADRYQITAIREDLGTLAGEVFRDLDDDGIRDPGEAPIPSTIITLTGDGIPLQATTDLDGQFSFENLSVGSYALTVQALPGLRDGNHTPGTLGGLLAGNAINQINMTVNADGTGYRFAKVSTSAVPHADLQSSFAEAPTGLVPDDVFDLFVRVRNNGPDLANGSLQLTVPNGLTLLDAQPTQGQWDPLTRTWQHAELAVRAEAALLLQLRADSAGSRILRSTLNTAQGDPVLGNNDAQLTISVSATGDLILQSGFEAKQQTNESAMMERRN